MIQLNGRSCLIGMLVIVILLTLLALSSFTQVKHDNHVTSSALQAFLDDYDLYDETARIDRSSLGCMDIPFPRNSAKTPLYITAWPNHGAGLGHQFGEWLYGPYLAVRYNLTYAHTGFLGNGLHWTQWLGFGAYEDVEEDVVAGNAPAVIHQWTEVDEHKEKSFGIRPWIAREREELAHVNADRFRRRNYSLQVSERNMNIQRTNESNSPTASSFARTISVVSTPSVDDMDVNFLARLYRIHVPHPSHDYSCYPPLNLLLRQKYCMARIRWPVSVNLYSNDRAADRMVIAVHLRCGDSCYDSYRATSFDSVKRTIRMTHDAITQNLRMQTSFHIFTQPPQGGPSAEDHFHPLLTDVLLTNISISTHFHLSSQLTLHHLIQADVLMGSQSSFSWIAFLLHHTTSFGPMPVCRWQVDYDKAKGDINTEQLINSIKDSRSHVPKFYSVQDCYDLKVLPSI